MDDQPPQLPPRTQAGSTSAGGAGKRSTLDGATQETLETASSAKPTPERIATQASNETVVDDRDGVDSGYGGSNSGTPGDKKATGTSSYGPGEVVLGESGLFGRKPKTMHRFNIPISPAHRTRYCDLEEAFCIALARLLAKKKKKHIRPLDIGLVVLGHDMTDARPCILVTCNKSIVRYVSSFFDESWVKEELNPDSSHGFPSFDLYVKSIPCKPKAAAAVEIFERTGDRDYLQDITNGYPIFAKTESGWKRSTLGGFVEVVKNPSQVDMYGFTAGHLISPWTSDGDSDSDSDGPAELSDGEGDEDFDNPLDIELDDIISDTEDSQDSGDKGRHPREPQSAVTDRSHTFEIPDSADLSALGHGFEVKTSGMGSKALDYALLSVGDKSRCFNSRPFKMPGTELPHESPSDPFQPRDVILLNAMGVGLEGSLSSHMSSLMLSPAAGFVKTYKLELTDVDEVIEGDSGAWVIDAVSNVVYGHVVAVDLYGNAHVIPLNKVLQDIKSGLDAIEVRLASSNNTVAATKQPVPASNPFQQAMAKQTNDSGYNTRENSKPTTTNLSSIEQTKPPTYPSKSPPDSAYNLFQNTYASAEGSFGASYGAPYDTLAGMPNPSLGTYPYYNPWPTSMHPPSYGLVAAQASVPPAPASAPVEPDPRTGYDSGYVSKQASPQNSDQSKDAGQQQYPQDDLQEVLVKLSDSIESMNLRLAQLQQAQHMQSLELDAVKASSTVSMPTPAGARQTESTDQKVGSTQPLGHDTAEKEVNLDPDHAGAYMTNSEMEHLSTTIEQAKQHHTLLEGNLRKALDRRNAQKGRIVFVDPNGIQYLVPLSRVKKSDDLKSFITQTVVPGLPQKDEYLRICIEKGKFDLKDRWGFVIPLQFWEDLAEPGAVSLHIWE